MSSCERLMQVKFMSCDQDVQSSQKNNYTSNHGIPTLLICVFNFTLKIIVQNALRRGASWEMLRFKSEIFQNYLLKN